MEKLDPIKSAEKVRADLNDELDANLEKAMGNGGKEEESGKQEEASENKAKETQKDAFISALNELLNDMVESKEISLEQAKDKRKAAALIETSFSDNPKHDALVFAEAGIAKEQTNDIGKKEKRKKMEEVELSDSHPVEETLSLEEDPSNPGQHLEKGKESSSENLEALRLEVEKAREEYIKKDYEIDKKANIIYRTLKIEGLKKLGLGNARDEVEEYKNNYEKALKDYKDAVVDSEHVEDKEDVEMVAHWLVARERLSLRSEQTDLKMNENYDWERLKKSFVGAVNKYRKLCSLPGKIVSKEISRLTGSKWVGLGLGITAGAGAMGVALNQAGLAGNPAFRIFSGLISTVGFKQMLEAGAEKKRVKKEEEEIEKIKNTAEESESINFEKIKELLDGKISEMDNQVQSEKQWKQWRTLMAAGAGTATAFGGYWLGQHATEYFQGRFGGEAPEIKGGAGEVGADKDLQEMLNGMKPQTRENFEEMKKIITEREIDENYTDEQIAQMARHPRADKFFDMLEKGTISEQMEQTYEKAVESLKDASPEEVKKIEELKEWMKLSPEERIETPLSGEVGVGEDFGQFKEWAEKNNMPFSEEELKEIYQWNGEGEISVGENNMSGAGKETMRQEVEKVLGGHELDTESVSGVEIAKSGDSVWRLAENQLENRGYFKGLTGTPEEILAKKTYLIDAIKDKIAENPKDFGMVDANKLQIGQKIDFSEIFENKNDIGNIIDKAESLGKGNIESITQNLAGESPSHGVGVETAEVKTEMPGVETPVEMSAGVLQYETAETIKICANNNIEDWNNIKNVLVVDSGQNEIVENIRTAGVKILPKGVVAPLNGDTVEKWVTRITNEAYKRGTLDDLREQLAANRKL